MQCKLKLRIHTLCLGEASYSGIVNVEAKEMNENGECSRGIFNTCETNMDGV